MLSSKEGGLKRIFIEIVTSSFGCMLYVCLNERNKRSYFLIDLWQMSSPLIEIKPIADNKIAAVQPAKLQVDVHLLIGPLHQHHSIHSLGLHLSE